MEETSADPDYDNFRTKLEEAKDSKGNPSPRYAVYDVEFELEGGEGRRFVHLYIYQYSSPVGRGLTAFRYRNKIVFISWVPNEVPMFVSH